MTKPLVFVKNKVRIEKIGKEVESWDLLAFGECPIMHAAWNPYDKFLTCQFLSHKENLIQIPKQSGTGKVTFKDSKADQYYRVTIYDLDSVQYILDTFVGNFNTTDWMLQDQFIETPVEVVEDESDVVTKQS